MSLSRYLVICSSFLLVCTTPGAQRTWDGGGNDGDWRTAQNWDGNIFLPIPIAQGDTLVFPAGPTKLVNTNDFGAGTNFTALTFSGDDYIVRGNMIGLTNGISVTHASGGTTLYLPITVRDDQSFTVANAGAVLYLNSDIAIGLNTLTFDGAGHCVLIGEITNGRFFGARNTVVKAGTGRLTILQQTDHDVPTVVNGGILGVEHRMTNSTVTVNAGGTLRGSGRIGGLNGNGGIIQPGGSTPDALQCYGDVSLAAGTIFRVRLNGTTAGVTYDQLEVQGAVTVGGTLEVTAGFLPAVGDRFTIIDNDGTDDIVGTFAGLPEGAVFNINGRPFKISYGDRFGGFGRDVNNVTIEAIPAVVTWDGGGALNHHWSLAQNWVDDVLPLPGDDVRFTNTTTLVTSNDFPAGRLFGSILFGTGTHNLFGNPAQIAGNLVMPPSLVTVNIQMPLALERGISLTQTGALRLAAICLLANQTLRTGPTVVSITNLTVNGYQLGLDVESVQPMAIYGSVAGPGTVTKTGPGQLILRGNNDVPTTVNEGVLSIDTAAYQAGKLTVGNGGSVFASGDLNELEVLAGGAFRPSYAVSNNISGTVHPTAYGHVRLHPGSFFDVDVGTPIANRHSTLTVGAEGFTASPGIEVAGATLRLNASGSFTLPSATLIRIPSYDPSPVVGTFVGLPQGGQIVDGDLAFGISYNGGPDADEVFIYQDPTFVWSGAAGDGLWSTPGNWAHGYAPVRGASLLFPSGAARYTTTNDFTNNFPFRELRFESALYVVAGNRLNITNSLSVDYTSGGATIQAELTTPGTTGSGNRLRLSVNTNTATLNLQGRIFGGNTWFKAGPGILRLAGAETNNPDFIRLSEGELHLAKVGANAVGRWLAIGDDFLNPPLPTTARWFASEQVPDSSTINIESASTLELNAHDETFRVLLGEGEIVLSSMPFQQGGLTISTGRFAGTITGFGTLTKANPGTLILSGTNTFIGTTFVAGGTLQVDGLQAVSFTRMNGGVLQGRGRIGPLQGGTGGIVSPGWGGAEFQNYLNCGNVTFNATTTFQPLLTSISSGFEAHRLQVIGTVNLGGSTLNLQTLAGFTPPTNRTFVIIDNDGADLISGTFSGLAEGALFGSGPLVYRISYVGGSGNDVTVTRVAAPPSDLTSIQSLGNGEVMIQGLGINGLVYDIQAASNLNSVLSWIQVGRGTGNMSGIFQFIHSNSPTIPTRFYRAVTP